jgi:hypothetical protein
MLTTVTYESLEDFTALPIIREAISRGSRGLLVSDLPQHQIAHGSSVASFVSLLLVLHISRTNTHRVIITAASAEIKQQGTRLLKAQSSAGDGFSPVMQRLHKLAHTVFKNISHAVELPWERYLGEMHEYNASGADELLVVSHGKAVPFSWSTLVSLL